MKEAACEELFLGGKFTALKFMLLLPMCLSTGSRYLIACLLCVTFVPRLGFSLVP